MPFRAEDELPPISDIAKANDMELQEIMENVARSMEDSIAPFEGHEMLPMHELQDLDKKSSGALGVR